MNKIEHVQRQGPDADADGTNESLGIGIGIGQRTNRVLEFSQSSTDSFSPRKELLA